MGGGDGHGYIGVIVNLGQVIAAQISLRRIFTIILVGCVIPIFRYLAHFALLLYFKSASTSVGYKLEYHI